MKLPLPNVKNHKYLALAYAIPCFSFLLLQLAIGVFPFGNYSMLYSDCYHQYYPFFKTFRETLLSGESLLYNWNVGMGLDFLGLYSYYLASPLNWLCVLVPESWTLAYFDLLYPIKLGFAGLFFAIFLKKLFQKDDLSISLFGSLYALCAWALCYQWNIMWVDTFALLPLVVLGMVSLLKEKKFILYTVTLFLSIFSNYYIGLFTCIFVLLSFFCYQICNFTTFKRFFGDLCRIAFFSIIAIGMTAILSLPTLAALQTTQSSVNKFPEGFKLNIADENTWKGLLDAMRQVAGNMGGGNITDQSFKDSHLPNIYCGVGTMVLAFLFLTSRHIKLREKLCCAFLLVLITVSFIVRQLDYIWHGFHFPNMIYNRFSFLFSFVMLYMAYRAYLLRRYFKPTHIAAAGILTHGLLLCSDRPAGFNLWDLSFDWLKLDRFDLNNLQNWKPDFNDPAALSFVYVVFNALFLALYLGVLLYGCGCKAVKWRASEKQLRQIVIYRRERRRMADGLFAYVIVLELILNIANFASSFSFTGITGYPKGTDNTEFIVSYMKEQEDELFYRAEVEHTQTLNDGALNSYYGVSTFTSSANVKVTEFMKDLGMSAKNTYNRYCYEDTSPVANMFLGLKYMIGRNSIKNPETQEDDSYISISNPYWDKIISRGNSHLLENNAYLPLGFLAESALADVDFSAGKTTFPLQNQLFTAATGIQRDVWTSLPESALTITPSNVTINSQSGAGYCSYTSSTSGSLTYSYNVTSAGFMCLDMTISNNSSHNYSIYKNDVLLYSDSFGLPQTVSAAQVQPGDTVKITVTCKDNESTSLTIRAAIMDDATFRAGYDILSASTLELTEFSNTYVAGAISCNRDGLMYTSIPQTGDNWVAYVDGQEAEISLVGDAMVAVELTQGRHTVEFRYKNSAFNTGCAVSFVCLVILAGAAVIVYKPQWIEAACVKLNIPLPAKTAKKKGKGNAKKKKKT